MNRYILPAILVVVAIVAVLLIGCQKDQPVAALKEANRIPTMTDSPTPITVNYFPLPQALAEGNKVIDYKDFVRLAKEKKGVTFVSVLKTGVDGTFSYKSIEPAPLTSGSCDGNGWAECLCCGGKEKLIVIGIPHCCMAWCGRYGMLIWCERCPSSCYSAVAQCSCFDNAGS